MPRARDERVALIAFAAAAVAAAAYILVLGRHLTYWWDEWWFVTGRIPWNAHVFLEPHQDHLSALPVLVYKTVLSAFGLDDYWVLRVIGVSVHVTCVAVLFAYVRRRVGAYAAFALSVPLLVAGQAVEDLLFPFQIGFLGSLAAGIGSLLAFDRKDDRGDATGAALVAVSLLCSAIGVAFLIAAAIDVGSRSVRRAAVVVGPPLLLFAAWYAVYGGTSADPANLDAVPDWIARAAVSGADAITHTGTLVAAVLCILLAGAVLAGQLHPPRRVHAHAGGRLLAVLAAAVAFWSLTALGRAGVSTPDQSRYIYPNAIFVALIAAETLRSRVPPRPARVLAGLAVVAAVLNAGVLHDGADEFQGLADQTRAAVTAVALADPPATAWAPGQQWPPLTPDFPAGYRRAVAAYGGSVAMTAADLHASPAARAAVDSWQLRFAPLLRSVPAQPAKLCAAAPADLPSPARAPVPAAGRAVWSSTPITVLLQRFGQPRDPPATVDIGPRVALIVHGGTGRNPAWRIGARSRGRVQTCVTRAVR